jgi:hypothetical protein
MENAIKQIDENQQDDIVYLVYAPNVTVDNLHKQQKQIKQN